MSQHGTTLAQSEETVPITSKIVAHEELCRDCQACLLACSLLHEGQCHPGLARLRVSKDMARYRFELSVCRHCDPAPCAEACPTGALRPDERAVVSLADDECLRCGACAEACPHGALFYHRASDRYLKCDLCAVRPEGPLCVALCPVGALVLE
ncbi:MAG: 4Fe-4S dicluster domain-containing protein [Chloroflexota bacterium]